MKKENEGLHATPTTADRSPAPGQIAPERIAEEIITLLDERKAEDIVKIPLAGKTTIADHMVIASGTSHRQVSALAEQLLRRLKELGLGRASVEGLETADWVLIDTGDVIVHLFRPEVRAFYNLEKLWGSAVATVAPEVEAATTH
ncbi:MAG: ribosome silencing factor [Alphaproteobacteria bacterium]|nr:MAG: ribosome silencing factor [Alphaproteobacteria bacterium]